MQKLNKKLFADFKKTPATEKISFIQKNAEALINTKLFDDCLKALETVGPEILQKKNGVEKHKEFELARKRLVTLPQEIEKQKKAEAQRLAEKQKTELELALVKKAEFAWENDLKTLEETIVQALLMAVDQNSLFLPENYQSDFEQLQHSKPASLHKKGFDHYETYLENIREYQIYKNIKKNQAEKETRDKAQNKKILKWVGATIAFVVGLGLGAHWYHKKTKAAQDQFLKEDIMRAKLLTHELTENKAYFKKQLKASSDTLFSVIDLPDQKQLSVLADTYLTTLRGFVESVNYRDSEELDLLISEVDKISKNFGKLLHFSLGSNSISVNSIDEINKVMQNQIDPHERLIFKKIEIYSLLGRSFMVLSKGFEFRNDKSRTLAALKEAKKFYYKVLDLNPQDKTADQNLMFIERSLKN